MALILRLPTPEKGLVFETLRGKKLAGFVVVIGGLLKDRSGRIRFDVRNVLFTGTAARDGIRFLRPEWAIKLLFAAFFAIGKRPCIELLEIVAAGELNPSLPS